MACGSIVHFWPPGTTRRKLPQKFNFSKLRVSPTHEAKEYGFWGLHRDTGYAVQIDWLFGFSALPVGNCDRNWLRDSVIAPERGCR